MSHKRHTNRHEAEVPAPPITISDGQLREQIELRAYFRYCERGCTPGRDVDDWLAAEQEVLASRQANAVPEAS